MNVDWDPDRLPPGTATEVITLPTPDRSATSGNLYRPAGGHKALIAISHPRVDMTRHYLIPALVRNGFAVWAQRTRTVNNDAGAVHEQLLIDLAVAHTYLTRERGFDQLFLLGNSGGAGLYCFYIQQSALAPDARLESAPSGAPVDLTFDMPQAAGLILVAPHPGQGELLLHCIDPAVVDEANPARSRAELDMFDPANGFNEPPQSSSYANEFLISYRKAQHERVSRLDSLMLEHLAQKQFLREAGRRGDLQARRQALSPTYVIVHRTDADPRTCDLSIDPSERDYGSIFGVRPDITNFGVAGFCRITTPEGWLSTWSGLRSRALLRLTGPGVGVPTLVLGYTADNSVFPDDIRAIENSIASLDKTIVPVRADHFGYIPGTTERNDETAVCVTDWLEARL